MPPVVAILGGGFTGAAVAYHLARGAKAGACRIVVVEPRAMLGAGLAYSTTEPAHRINVPAAKMSLDSADPEAFARWLRRNALPENDAAATTTRGDVFPQRGLFGRYVAGALAPFVTEGRVEHRRALAGEVRRRTDGRFDIALSDGNPLRADILVLATTHPLPGVPAPLRPVAASPRFVADPYDPDRLAGIDREARILVVGNGLTSADTVAALHRRGHRGAIVTLSRNGLRSRGHPAEPVSPFGDFTAEPSRTARGLVRRIRQGVAEAAHAGLGWHPVLDTVRNQGPAIWQALPETERRRLVRHLRAFWDVHRFRIAPQVERLLDRLTAEGRVKLMAATLVSSSIRTDGTLDIAFRPSHSETAQTSTFDAVINTTGPAHRGVVGAEPARSLHAAGLLALDRVGLGLATAPSGHAVDAGGASVPGLFIAGPLARGTFGELMGLLEVTRYAEFVAAAVARDVDGFGHQADGGERRPTAPPWRSDNRSPSPKSFPRNVPLR